MALTHEEVEILILSQIQSVAQASLRLAEDIALGTGSLEEGAREGLIQSLMTQAGYSQQVREITSIKDNPFARGLSSLVGDAMDSPLVAKSGSKVIISSYS